MLCFVLIDRGVYVVQSVEGEREREREREPTCFVIVVVATTPVTSFLSHSLEGDIARVSLEVVDCEWCVSKNRQLPAGSCVSLSLGRLFCFHIYCTVH